MPLDFPSNPTNGQVDPSGQYVYDSSITSWRNIGSTNNLASRITDVSNATGLKTIVPIAVTVTSGSASVNSMGVVSFTGMSQLELENVFTSEYKNYQVKVNFSDFSNATDVAFRGKSAGTIYAGGQYYLGGFTIRAAATQLSYSSNPDNRAYFGGVTTSATWHTSTIQLFSPQVSTAATSFTFSTVGYNGSVANIVGGGLVGVNTPFDSFVLLPAGGTCSGTVQIFGYND